MMLWWNFATQSDDEREPDTDEIAAQYIPQGEAAQGLYMVKRERGLSIIDAMIDVLDACAGTSGGERQ